MIALVFGQSQSANLVGERFMGKGQVYNFFRGQCYAARDPLLGTTNSWGNVWTLIGNELVQKKLFDAVILVTIGIGGTAIAQWAPGGELHAHLMRTVHSMGPDLSITHVFIQQGETDLWTHTAYEKYYADFLAVVKALQQSGVGAPIYVLIESGYCDGTPPKLDNPIVRAQKQLIVDQPGVYQGADMDRELDSVADRYDGCHMSGTGARKLSNLLVTTIATTMPR
jgi:hypothetical protein